MAIVYKAGVSGSPSPAISFAINFAAGVYVFIGRDLVVTSMRDSQHSADSLHYSGNAVDLRTNDLSPAEKQAVYSGVRSALYSQGFDVILESDHLHIEYQPQGSRRWAGDTSYIAAPLPVSSDGTPYNDMGFSFPSFDLQEINPLWI